jgi:hypothetical protein
MVLCVSQEENINPEESVMTSCKYCSSRIDDFAFVCPFCMRKQPDQIVVSNLNRKFVIWIVIIAVLFGVIVLCF